MKSSEITRGVGIMGGLLLRLAGGVQSVVAKAYTAFTDTTAKDTLTVSVLNVRVGAIIEVDVLASLGTGGAIGAGEGTRVSKYQVVLARTPGVAVVATASAAIGGAEAHVAGAASITSAVVSLGTVGGGVTATNTFTIKVAITKSAGSSDNHTAIVAARIISPNATGVTIA